MLLHAGSLFSRQGLPWVAGSSNPTKEADGSAPNCGLTIKSIFIY